MRARDCFASSAQDQAALEALREELALCERQLLATQEALEAAEKAKEVGMRASHLSSEYVLGT